MRHSSLGSFFRSMADEHELDGVVVAVEVENTASTARLAKESDSDLAESSGFESVKQPGISKTVGGIPLRKRALLEGWLAAQAIAAAKEFTSDSDATRCWSATETRTVV